MQNLSEIDHFSPLARSCRADFPFIWCSFANICGFVSTGIWFLVLAPQIWVNFRNRSTEGLSFIWAAANFTAALNSSFFVFKTGRLPVYIQIMAIYMPIMGFLIILEFYLFAVIKKIRKHFATVLCLIIWAVDIFSQSYFNIFNEMQWVSITLWILHVFPQIFLNSKRESTQGLATLMVILATIGKTTDFLSTYLLLLPLQYVIMAFFSSTTAIICTLQVLWYWNKPPRGEAAEKGSRDASPEHRVTPDEEGQELSPVIEGFSINPWCQFVRFVGLPLLVVELGGFAAGIVWRTDSWWSVFAPISTYLIVALGWLYYHRPAIARKDRHSKILE